MKRFLLIFSGIILVGLLIAVLSIVLHAPRSDKNWREDLSRLPSGEVQADGTIHMRDVRDWTYASSTITWKSWLDESVDPKKITRAWFIVEPFPAWGAVGHTYLTFDFSDGTTLSFSIEARLEDGEPYSAWKGLFNSYELMYTWGTERDFLARRMLFLGHDVRMYPLAISPDTASALFRRLVEETNKLDAKPRFYNTLTENCTNALAYIVNGIAPNTLPWDWSWYLTGLSDGYLMHNGFIATVDGSVAKTQARYDLAPFRDTIAAIAEATPQIFSATLRSLLKAL